MAYLIVENDEAGRLATEIAKTLGRPVHVVVIEALQEKLDRLPKKEQRAASFDELLSVADRIAERAKGSKTPHS